MNKEQLEVMRSRNGFIAALDQSGGSTPKALLNYGIDQSMYHNDNEMFAMIHQMRSRIMQSEAFTSEKILAAILFEATMYSEVDGLLSGDYLWDEKKIVPFLKIDKGLLPVEQGVALMAPIPDMDEYLDLARNQNMFGTKMRSVIYNNDEAGIKAIVDQQFEFADIITKHDLVPIIEPEVDIHAEDKGLIEQVLRDEIKRHLDGLDEGVLVMLKLTPPDEADFYAEFVKHPNILRVAFLSGGYPRAKANELLSQNHGVVASFSRALTEGLAHQDSDLKFDLTLEESINEIFNASIT